MENYAIRSLTPEEMDKEEEILDVGQADKAYFEAALKPEGRIFRTFLRDNLIDQEPI